MVTIVKGNLENNVPISSYNNFFKANGWVLKGAANAAPQTPSKSKVKPEEEVVEPEEVQEDEVQEEEIAEDEWDDALSELQDEEVEKPLSEMNKEELMQKAKSLNIKVPNGSSNKQIRELIKASV